MIYGYLRVSTDKQDADNQKLGVDDFARRHGWSIDKYIVDDGVSGSKDPAKRRLGPLLRKLKKGDVLIASEISRLGRDLLMVMDILHFCMTRGCVVCTVKDNFTLGDDISSKVLAFAFGLSAEIERKLISQRTKEALARKRLEGVALGRKVGSKTRESLRWYFGKENRIRQLIAEGKTHNEIARLLHVHRTTFARYISEHRDSLPYGGRPQKFHTGREDELRTAILSGEPIASIAKRYGVPFYIVYDFASRRGLLHWQRGNPPNP